MHIIFAAQCYASAAYVVMRCHSHNFCRALLCKCGLCRHVVSICLSVTFVNSVKTNKHIVKFISPSGSHTILDFPCQTA